jgi:hypothetical protein
MKKQSKKLVLAKETVRSLTRVESRWVAGGVTTEETETCGCYTGTCGTGYCGTGAPTAPCWSDPNYSCQRELKPAATSVC